jgi:hypothetical protein
MIEDKLIEEGGKVANETIKNMISSAREFLKPLVGPPLHELGLLAQDHVRFWRLKNQVRIVCKAREFLESNGIKPQKIHIKTLAPLLEYGSLEEDETLQNMWAMLLAKAFDPQENYNLTNMFIEIMRQLSPIEVRLLDLLFNTWKSNNEKDSSEIMWNHSDTINLLGLSVSEYGVILTNLTRLGILVTGSIPYKPSAIADLGDGRYLGQVLFSDLGEAFLDACLSDIPKLVTEQ